MQDACTVAVCDADGVLEVAAGVHCTMRMFLMSLNYVLKAG